MTSPRESFPAGTRPEGTRDEEEAAGRVREMFGSIVARYDFLNHLLSFSCDRWWRRRAAARLRLALRPGARVLDACCGTGDLAFAFERVARQEGKDGAVIFASDFVHAMLVRAQAKARQRSSGIRLVGADTLRLPFAGQSFDLAAAAFGFRNLANYGAGMAELRRILRPGGWLAILEFAEPPGRVFGRLYRFYFKRILPVIGGILSGSRAAYGYLPSSVARFPSPEELADQLRAGGFAEVRFERWLGGIVAFHAGRAPEGRSQETLPASR